MGDAWVEDGEDVPDGEDCEVEDAAGEVRREEKP